MGNEPWEFSACLEWLFADGGRPFGERVAKAAESGFGLVEFWGTKHKDVAALEAALRDSDVGVAAFVSEPTGRIVDPSTHEEFLAGVERSAVLAKRLSARNLIVVSGDTRPGIAREEQRHAIVEALRLAAPIAERHGVDLLLEPLNTSDHAGYFLDSTVEGLEIIRVVGQPHVKLLYDVYHSVAMGEEPSAVLAGAGNLVGHVHVADVPGRHEPGTGAIDWGRALGALRRAGYAGPLGLEYMPTGATVDSLAFIRAC